MLLPRYLVAISLLAFALGALLRHSAGALTAVIALLLVVENVLMPVPVRAIQMISPFLPSTAGRRVLFDEEMISAIDAANGGAHLTAWQGFGVLLAWVVALLGLAAVLCGAATRCMHSLLGGPRWEGDYVDIATGPVTELDAPRPGPVRRFFAGRPAAMPAVVIVAFVAGVAVSTVDPLQSRSVIAAVVIAAVGAAALAFRRSHPLPVAGAMGALAVGAVAVTGQLAGVELGVGFALYAVAIAHTTPTAWLTAAVTTAASLLAVWLWEEPTVDPVATGRSGALVLTDDRWASSAGVLVMAPAGL